MLEQIGDGLVLLDHQWRYLYLNPQALRMLRRRRRENLLGRSIWSEFPAAAGTPVQRACERALQTHRTEVVELYYEPLGTWFECRIHPQPESLSIYFTDIGQRKRAEQSLQEQRAELSALSRQLIVQEQATVRRLSQRLHDGLGQTLALLRMRTGMLRVPPQAGSAAASMASVEAVEMLLDRAWREMRELLAEMRPQPLQDEGLVAALEHELRSHAARERRTALRLQVDEGLLGQRWPDEVEDAAYMIAREAIVNSLRHAGASQIRLELAGSPRELRLEIADDGCGLPQSLRHGRPGHLGLVGMRERALAIGAELAIEPAHPHGCRVRLAWRAAEA